MLKIMAIIIGCSCWLKYSYDKPTIIQVDVPVSCYNLAKEQTFKAPETVTIMLQGLRTDLYRLHTDELAIHIDGDMLHDSCQTISITRDMLLLPKDVHLLGRPTASCIVHDNDYGLI